ncbi:MAG: hypothetical protein ACLFTV_07245 [Desulfococcaceae bacterium]
MVPVPASSAMSRALTGASFSPSARVMPWRMVSSWVSEGAGRVVTW